MLQIAEKGIVEHFIAYFRKNGFNDNGIAGLLGNIYAESGVRTNNLQNRYNTEFGMSDEEFTAAVDRKEFNFCDPNIKFGYGLCQWTSLGRRTGLYNYCVSKGASIADEQSQFEWLLHELQSSYKTVYNELISNSNSIESCASIVLCKYEIPKSVLTEGEEKQKTINRRTEYAKEFYEEFLKGSIKMKKTVIAINAGHWLGNAKGVPKSMPVLAGTLEWELNCRVVNEVVKMLSKYDVEVVQNYDITGTHGWTITNTDPKVVGKLIKDKSNELEARIQMAENAKADIYLSIHHNGGINGGTGGGTTVFYYSGNATNQRQATEMYNEIKARTGLKGNRSTPVKGTRDYTEITVPTMNSYIIECAFMDSVTDIYYINKPEWASQVASGIVAFLVKEYGLQTQTVVAAEPIEKPVEITDNSVKLKISIGEIDEVVTVNVGDCIRIERV